MTEQQLIDLIKRNIEDDNSIKVTGIKIDISGKSLLGKKKQIRFSGKIDSEMSKKNVTRIAEHHAGNRYEVINELAVK